MQEAGLSINFHAYTGEGLQTQVTIRGATPEEFFANTSAFFGKYPQLGGLGIMLMNPPEGSLKPKRFHIIGWMRGETTNRNDPNDPNPAVYLYCDVPQMQWAICTVYKEDLDKLPINWQNARNAGGSPPPADRARSQWVDCDFHIAMYPEFDHEGNPKKNDRGTVKFRFGGCINEDGSPRETVATSPVMPVQPVQAPQTNAQRAAAPVPQQVGNRAPAPTQRPVQATQAPLVPDNLGMMATIFDNLRHSLSAEVVNFVTRMRALDADRVSVLTVDGVKEDGTRKIGQYEFLCGVIDTLTKEVAGIEGLHKEILSIVYGRPIWRESRPGSATRAFFDEIWPGTADRANPNMNMDSRDAVVSIAYLAYNELNAEEDAPSTPDDRSDIPF